MRLPLDPNQGRTCTPARSARLTVFQADRGITVVIADDDPVHAHGVQRWPFQLRIAQKLCPIRTQRHRTARDLPGEDRHRE